jgi:hypothetical protein
MTLRAPQRPSCEHSNETLERMTEVNLRTGLEWRSLGPGVVALAVLLALEFLSGFIDGVFPGFKVCRRLICQS